MALATAASWWVLCIASPSAAQAEDSASEADTAGEKGASKEGEGKEKSRLNSIRLSGAYAHHRLHHRNSQTTGEPLDTRENLGGFEIAYERELIEEHLSIECTSAKYFGQEGTFIKRRFMVLA